MATLNLMRKYLWDRIKRLHTGSGYPWLCIGDFNELYHQDEKVGLRPHSQYKIDLFRDLLDRNGLMEMEVKGCRFTRHSNPRNGVVVKERIDRVLAN